MTLIFLLQHDILVALSNLMDFKDVIITEIFQAWHKEFATLNDNEV